MEIRNTEVKRVLEGETARREPVDTSDAEASAGADKHDALDPAAVYDPPELEAEEQLVAFENTQLVREWRHSVKFGDPDDYVIAITASSATGVSGTGKTTAGQSLAKYFDVSGSGYSAEDQGTLRPSELAYDILPETNGGEAVVLEEAQGTPESSGLDTRRALTDEVIDTIAAILANRDQRLTLIIVAQRLSMIDTRLYPLIDSWLLIRYSPSHDNGPLMTHHHLIVDDYDFNNPDIRTPAVEDFRWPRIPHNDPDYRVMERKKQEAKRDAPEDADPGEIDQDTRNFYIKKLDDETELDQGTIGNIFDLSRGQVNRIVNDKT